MDGNHGNATLEAKPETRRFQLSPKQHDFFMSGRAAAARLNDQMNGALQVIAAENELKGSKIMLSEDATEIIIED